jgi:hypothetical protein
MSNILIVADGKISLKFIETIELKNVTEHTYTVLVKDESYIKDSNFINFEILDPTSLFRIRRVCKKDKFAVVFIVYENMDEAYEIYKNIRTLNKKVRVVTLDTDDKFKDIEDSYLNIVDVNMVISNRLYDFLPNVPVVAQTIGLNEGEIMEVIVPFSSPYAFRHIGSIPQIKWKIAAIYREDKLILPTNATMIRPRDRLLIIGKPQVLVNVYKRVHAKQGTFPEPFGKNFYLYLDIDKDAKKVIDYIEDAIYLLDKFEDKKLTIRVVNPNDFEVINKIKSYDNNRIRSYISFGEIEKDMVSNDINRDNIGLIMVSNKTLGNKNFGKELYSYKKLIYVFGDTKISNIKEATVVKSDERELEEISSVAFYIADTLHIKLSLREYDPQGEFKDSQSVIEHYETLAHVHNMKIDIIKEKKNPIKAIKESKNILLLLPFSKDMSFNGILAFLKRDVDTLLLRTNRHPKLLISIEE